MFLDVLGLLALAHVLTRDLAARIAHELGCRTSRDGERGEVAPVRVDARRAAQLVPASPPHASRFWTEPGREVSARIVLRTFEVCPDEDCLPEIGCVELR